MPRIDAFLKIMQEYSVSDLHLSANCEPMLRINGVLQRGEHRPLSEEELRITIYELLTEAQIQALEADGDLDLAYTLPGVARFRINVYKKYPGLAAAFRIIPNEVPTLEQLGMPPVLKNMLTARSGLILVTGPTNSGKSTTLAAMVNHLNESEYGHVLTVEDPIEFVHESKKCLINQREVGPHTLSFANALRSALREDPDYILVGEMRDLETIRLALTAAETGHLVFGTLHTSSAAKTIDRIIDVFPAAEKDMVRAMLSESLVSVISQTLLKTKDGQGRLAAHEIMIGTPAIRNLIRENKVAQMYSAIQTSQAVGMQTLDQNLVELVRRNMINVAEARNRAVNKDLFMGA